MDRARIEALDEVPPDESSDVFLTPLMAEGRVLVAECIDDHHPSILGRVRVRAGDLELWVPTLQHLAVRIGDQVLLQQPTNWPEPVVVGVLDGFRRRPNPKTPASRLELKPDEAIQVVDGDQRELFEFSADEDGTPRLTIKSPSLDLHVDGKLTLSGSEVELQSRDGDAKIRANRDVVVDGELIRLNS